MTDFSIEQRPYSDAELESILIEVSSEATS